MMDCGTFAEALAAHALGEPIPGQGGLGAHLSDCRACRGRLASLSTLALRVREAAPPPDPARGGRLRAALAAQDASRLPEPEPENPVADLAAWRRRRARRARSPSLALPIGLAATAAAGLLAWCGMHPEYWRQTAPVTEPAGRDGRISQAPTAATRMAAPEVAQTGTGAPSSTEAVLPAGEAQEARYLAAAAEAGKAESEGRLPEARGILTAFLEAGASPERSRDVQLRLADLDRRMEQAYEAGAAEAREKAGAGRFGEARALLSELQARYAGLPWGSAAEARLAELAGLEAQATRLAQAQARRDRAEAKARRSAEEHARGLPVWEERQRRFAKLLLDLPSKEGPRRRDAWAEIAAFDPAVGPAVLEALDREHRHLVSRLQAKLNSEGVRRMRDGLQGDLDGRRREALALIRDEQRYPYLHGAANPYGPDGAKVEREVAGLVAAVENLYRPTQALLKTLREKKDLQKTLADLEEVEGYLAQAGHAPPRARSGQGMLEAVVTSIDLSREAETASANARILAANEETALRMQSEGTLDAEEAACVLTTNQYRIMMGLAPLRIDGKLTRASRGHSGDMGRRGFFAHVDPDGRGPGERARAAGFAGPVGENLHGGQGSGRGAFEGWRHSSGHHRNMLVEGWTMIGVGRSDGLWTMLLGSGEPASGPVPRPAGRAGQPGGVADTPYPPRQP